MLIMQEMIQTESDYIRSLQLVIENYMPEMSKDSVPQPLRGKRNIIFGNIEKIYEFHSQYFQAELQQCENNPYHTGHIFMQHVSINDLPLTGYSALLMVINTNNIVIKIVVGLA